MKSMFKFKTGDELKDGIDEIVVTSMGIVDGQTSAPILTESQMGMQTADKSMLLEFFSGHKVSMTEDEALRIIATGANNCASEAGKGLADQPALYYLCDDI